MQENAVDLWELAFGIALAPYMRSSTLGLKQLTHLANERFPSLPPVAVNEQDWSIELKPLSLVQIATYEGWHFRMTPRATAPAYIAAHFRGCKLLLDGTKSVNRRGALGLGGVHPVLIISPLVAYEDAEALKAQDRSREAWGCCP